MLHYNSRSSSLLMERTVFTVSRRQHILSEWDESRNLASPTSRTQFLAQYREQFNITVGATSFSRMLKKRKAINAAEDAHACRVRDVSLFTIMTKILKGDASEKSRDELSSLAARIQAEIMASEHHAAYEPINLTPHCVASFAERSSRWLKVVASPSVMRATTINLLLHKEYPQEPFTSFEVRYNASNNTYGLYTTKAISVGEDFLPSQETAIKDSWNICKTESGCFAAISTLAGFARYVSESFDQECNATRVTSYYSACSFTANRDIAAGEEICVDFGLAFWIDDLNANAVPPALAARLCDKYQIGLPNPPKYARRLWEGSSRADEWSGDDFHSEDSGNTDSSINSFDDDVVSEVSDAFSAGGSTGDDSVSAVNAGGSVVAAEGMSSAGASAGGDLSAAGNVGDTVPVTIHQAGSSDAIAESTIDASAPICDTHVKLEHCRTAVVANTVNAGGIIDLFADTLEAALDPSTSCTAPSWMTTPKKLENQCTDEQQHASPPANTMSPAAATASDRRSMEGTGSDDENEQGDGHRSNKRARHHQVVSVDADTQTGADLMEC